MSKIATRGEYDHYTMQHEAMLSVYLVLTQKTIHYKIEYNNNLILKKGYNHHMHTQTIQFINVLVAFSNA